MQEDCKERIKLLKESDKFSLIQPPTGKEIKELLEVMKKGTALGIDIINV